MTDRNANRPGYKKTRVGWIPEEWECKYLRDIGSFKNGISKSADQFGTGFPIVNIQLLFEANRVVSPPDDLVESSISDRTAFNLKKGDILFVRSSVKPEGVGLSAVVENDLNNTVYSGFIIRFRPKTKVFSIRFARYLFDNYQFRKDLMRKSTVSANTNINQPSLGSLQIQIPSVTEQRKIAEILSTWDRAIEQTRALIDAKQRLKRGLMQQLLTGRLRFPGFGPPAREKGELPAGWRKYEFSKLAGVSNEKFHPQKNEEGMRCIELEHIEQGTGRVIGWVNSSDQSSTKNKFAPSDVLFGKLRPYLRKFAYMDFEGVCSSEIWVLQAKSIVLAKYLYLLIQTDRFMSAATQTTGTKMPRADWDVVSRQVFFIPDMNEQKKIVEVIASIDAGEKILAKRINYLLTSKKGLLQKLLSGEIRTC